MSYKFEYANEAYVDILAEALSDAGIDISKIDDERLAKAADDFMATMQFENESHAWSMRAAESPYDKIRKLESELEKTKRDLRNQNERMEYLKTVLQLWLENSEISINFCHFFCRFMFDLYLEL